MIIAPGFIGIDVSKSHLDVFDAVAGRCVRIDNRPAALAGHIHGWAQRDAFVLFEATGRYDLTLRAGQFKLPLLREWLVSSTRQLSSERSAVGPGSSRRWGC